MKTIAISIDEPTLERIDRIARKAALVPAAKGQQRRGGSLPARRLTRSQLIRTALQEFLLQHERREWEERERLIFAKHRERLARQAEALVAEQAGQ